LRWGCSAAKKNEQAEDLADLSWRLVPTTLPFAFCVLQLWRKMAEVAAAHFIIIIAPLSMGFMLLK
jgi:hypothetical protein